MADLPKDIVDLQDIEKIQFLQTLKADPARYAAYIQDKTKRIVDETVDTKRASFFKSSGDMARTLDMDRNSYAALVRTQELEATQDQILAQQRDMRDSTIFNRDMTRRQAEINEWYYENKRETLFVLQLTLLVVLTVVVTLSVAQYGWISQDGADYVMGFVIVVGVITWVYRWYYTAKIRDPRYWSTRRFAGDGASSENAKRDELCAE